VFIDAEHPRAEFVHVRQPEQAGLRHGGLDHPPRHRETGSGLRDGPAGADDRVRELVPEPGRGAGTGRHLGVDSKNESLSHAGSSQYQRYLDQSTSTGPATGMSRIRWKRRSFRRVATTPQLGQPGGWSVSTMIWRRPSASTVTEMTRYSGRLKMLVAASNATTVGSWFCSWFDCLANQRPRRALGTENLPGPWPSAADPTGRSDP
jgi:uncharacterized protein YodC (DUF2158 family)